MSLWGTSRAPAASTATRIDGARPLDNLGRSVAGAGDLNGDARADVAVGAPAEWGTEVHHRGHVYGLFTPPNVASTDLGDRASWSRIEVVGAGRDDNTGLSLGAGRDVNGDGLDDLLVGAPWATSVTRHAGRAALVWGRSDAVTLRFDELGSSGKTFGRSRWDDGYGSSVAIADDLSGDGRLEAMVGAPFENFKRRVNAGRVYVRF